VSGIEVYTHHMSAKRDRYRWRTRLRGVLPSQLSLLVPKGRQDCGDHEWYRSSESLDACYHCRVGTRPHVAALTGEERGTEPLLERELAKDGHLDGRPSQPVP